MERDRHRIQRATVSIQLISPASGDSVMALDLSSNDVSASFHSTDFPSEWGPGVKIALGTLTVEFPFN